MKASLLQRLTVWLFPEAVVPVARDARPATPFELAEILRAWGYTVTPPTDHAHAGPLTNARKGLYECRECGEPFRVEPSR